jgi:hypothetical protein
MRTGFAVNTEELTLHIFLNGKNIRRATLSSLSPKDTYYAFASPFRPGVSVKIAVPKHLPRGVRVGTVPRK